MQLIMQKNATLIHPSGKMGFSRRATLPFLSLLVHALLHGR